VLIGRNLDLLVIVPVSWAGLGESGAVAKGWARAGGASVKDPPVSVSGVPWAISFSTEARRRLALVLVLFLLVFATSIHLSTLLLVWEPVSLRWL
jgi:hypothetical protein